METMKASTTSWKFIHGGTVIAWWFFYFIQIQLGGAKTSDVGVIDVFFKLDISVDEIPK